MNDHFSPTPQSPQAAQTEPSAPAGPNLSPHSPPPEPAQPAPVEQTKRPRPWELQPGESAKAFDAFQRFLALGPDATVRDLAKSDPSDYEALKKLGTRHSWRERAAAHRQHEAQLQSEAFEQALTETTALFRQRAQLFNQQQWELTQLLTSLGYEAVQQVRDAKLPTPRLDEISCTFSTIARLGRQSFELPAGPQLPSPQDQAADLEREISLNKVYGPMAAAGVVPSVKDLIERRRHPAQPNPPQPPAPDTPKTS